MTRCVWLLGVALSALGCQQNDLNRPCNLRFSDGGAIPERLAREYTLNNKDFVAVGATDCDSLICVRDSSYRSTAADDQDAQGYCSRECITPGNVCETEKPENDQPNSPNRLTCKELLLSEIILADPIVRAQLGVSGSLFCSRSGRLDGGT